LWGTILAANDITLTSLFCWNIPVFNQGLCGVDIARHTKKQPFWWINIIYSWVGFENMVRKSKVVLQKSMTPISCSHSLFAINQYKSYGPLRTPTESGKRHRQNDLGRIRSHLKRLMANSSHQMIIIHGHPWPSMANMDQEWPLLPSFPKKNRAKTKVLKFCGITLDITQGSLRGSLSFQTILSGIRWPTFLASGIRCFFLQSFR